MADFSATVDRWVLESRQRMIAVFRTAAQYVIEEAQKVRGAGGNMRVDTGFLRASGSASLSSMPVINPNAVPTPGGSYGYSESAATLVIAQAGIGDTIYWGWTAAYAGYRENDDGFMRSAAMQWPYFVEKATAEAKARVG